MFDIRYIFLLLMLGMQSCHEKLLPYNIGRAMSQASQIGMAIWTYNQDQQNVDLLLGKAEFGFIKGDRVIEVLAHKASASETTGSNGIQYLEWHADNYNDPWGHPYMIAWQKSENPTASESLSVFVWSFGPNGINEFGQGDDVFSLNGVQMVWPKPKTEREILRKSESH